MTEESYRATEGKQLIILTEQVRNLTSTIGTLVERMDKRDAILAEFQSRYYVEHQKITSSVVEHAKDISEIEESVSQIQTRTAPLDDSKKLRDVVFGNGSVGLVGRISKMEDWVAAQIWFQRLLIGAIVGQVVTLIVLLFHTIKY